MGRTPGDTWTSSTGGETVSGGSDTSAFGAGEPRYEDQEQLGQGGLGRVVATHDTVLDRVVARKEVLSNRRGHHERFVREARITARLEHPSIVPVYEAGTLPDGTPWYTMKRIDGRSLAEALRIPRTLPERLGLLDVLLRVCQAAAYAHEQGVIHRDLKPENVMLGRFGETWVVDWGLARRLDEGDQFTPPIDGGTSRSLTRVGAIVGTPGWMSPEQARGELVGPGSDVWSLGAMLYALLTGGPPFVAATADEVLELTRSRPVPPVRERQPDAPVDLAAVVDKALQPDPSRRYADAGELADELQAWLVGGRVSAYTYSPWQVLRHEAYRHRTRLLAGGMVAVALVLGLAEAERRETVVSNRALASSLTRLGAIALEDRDLLLAGAHAAVALDHREDPEARGIAARALAATPPRRVAALQAGFPCRWLRLTPDDGTVLCGGEGLVAFRDGAEAWRWSEGTLAGALSPDGARAAVLVGETHEVRVVDVHTGETVATHSVGEDVRSVGWGVGPVWGGERHLHGTDGRRTLVCASTVVTIEREPKGALAVTCVNGTYGRFDPETLEALDVTDIGLSVRYALHPTPDGSVWLGFHRSVRKLAGGVLGEPIVLGGYPVSIAGSPDGQWVVAAMHQRQAAVIDAERQVPWLTVPTGGTVSGVAFDGEGALWTSGPLGPTRWKLPAAGVLETLTDIADAAPMGPEHLVVAGVDGQMTVIHLPSGRRTDAGTHPGRAILAIGDRVLVQRGFQAGSSVGWVGSDDTAVVADDVVFTGLVAGGLLGVGTHPRRSVLYDPDTFTLRHSRPGIRAQAMADGSVLAVVDGDVEALDPLDLQPLERLPADLGDGWLVDLVGPLSDGRWAWVDPVRGRVGLVDRGGGIVPLVLGPDTRPSRVWALGDERLLIEENVGRLVVHDLRETVARLPAGEARLGEVAVAPDGLVVATDWDGRVMAWDLDALEMTPSELRERLLEGSGFQWRDGRIERQ